MQAEEAKGPCGEAKSQLAIDHVAMIPMDRIVDDPEFANCRLAAERDKLDLLTESMKHEGLKIPVTVIESVSKPGYYHVRAGFRRTTAARELNWTHIPATILPLDTPIVEEYWTNIIENTGRDQLSTYEVAKAAQTMRDRFKTSPEEFGRRAGYSANYVMSLLRCIDRLPEEVLKGWKAKAPIPLSLYVKWSALLPEEILTQYKIALGRMPHPIVREFLPPSKKSPKHSQLKLATSWGLQRMQRVRFAIEVARKIDENTRQIALEVVDFCMGAKATAPLIGYDPARRQRLYKDRTQAELPEELPELPTEMPVMKNGASR